MARGRHWIATVLAIVACSEGDDERFDDPCGTLVSSTVLPEVYRFAYGDGALFVFGREGVSRYEPDALGDPTWRTEPLGAPVSLTYVDGELHAISHEPTASWQRTAVSRIDATGNIVAQSMIDPPTQYGAPRSALTTSTGLSFVTGGGFGDAWWVAVEPGDDAIPDTSAPNVGRVSGIAVDADEAWFIAQTYGAAFIENNEVFRMNAQGQVLTTVPLTIAEGPRWGDVIGFGLTATRNGFLLTSRVSLMDADYRMQWFDASGVPNRELVLVGMVNEFPIVPFALPNDDTMLVQARDSAKLDLTRIDDAGIACTRTFDMPPSVGGFAYGGAFDGDTFYLLVVDAVLVFRGAFDE